jgi:hypothetical protein
MRFFGTCFVKSKHISCLKAMNNFIYRSIYKVEREKV